MEMKSLPTRYRPPAISVKAWFTPTESQTTEETTESVAEESTPVTTTTKHLELAAKVWAKLKLDELVWLPEFVWVPKLIAI